MNRIFGQVDGKFDRVSRKFGLADGKFGSLDRIFSGVASLTRHVVFFSVASPTSH